MKKAATDILRLLHAVEAKLDRVLSEMGALQSPAQHAPGKVIKPISRKKVREMTSLSLAQIDRLEKEGKFPKRICLTDHPRGRCAYLENEIVEWIANRLKATRR